MVSSQRICFLAVLSLLLLAVPDLMAQRGKRAAGTPAGSAPTPLPKYGFIITVHGKLKELNKKQLVVQGDDGRVWTLRRTSKTKFYRGDKQVKPFEIDLETLVSVEMTEDNDLKFRALTLKAETKEKKSSSNAS